MSEFRIRLLGLVGVIAALWLLGSLLGSPGWTQTRNDSVAPEVCEQDGYVQVVYRQGDLLRVTCSDGLDKLYHSR